MKIVLDLAPHDVMRAVEALRGSRGMIATEVAEKIEAAATEAGKVDITDLVCDLTAPSPGVASPGGRFACSPDPILPESTTEGATTFPARGADDAPDESKGAVPNAAPAPAPSELAYLRKRWWAVRDLLLQWDREQEVIKNILAAVTDQPRVDAMALAQMAMVDELRAIVETAP